RRARGIPINGAFFPQRHQCQRPHYEVVYRCTSMKLENFHISFQRRYVGLLCNRLMVDSVFSKKDGNTFSIKYLCSGNEFKSLCEPVSNSTICFFPVNVSNNSRV